MKKGERERWKGRKSGKRRVKKGWGAREKVMEKGGDNGSKGSIGGKRLSVATIPAARRSNISPARGSYDNLAGVFHTGKNSFVGTPQVHSKNKAQAHPVTAFGSKRNSMTKLLGTGPA